MSTGHKITGGRNIFIVTINLAFWMFQWIFPMRMAFLVTFTRQWHSDMIPVATLKEYMNSGRSYAVPDTPERDSKKSIARILAAYARYGCNADALRIPTGYGKNARANISGREETPALPIAMHSA